jgi:hypothetical protein
MKRKISKIKFRSQLQEMQHQLHCFESFSAADSYCYHQVKIMLRWLFAITNDDAAMN